MGIPTLPSIPPISLLFFPLLLIYAQDNNSSPKNCPNSFQCGTNGSNIQFPLHNNDTHPGCGLIPVKCSGTAPIIYLEWFLQNMEFRVKRFVTNQSAKVVSPGLLDLINSTSCDTISYLNPLYYSSDDISYTISPNLTLFRCDNSNTTLKKSSDNYFNSSYYYSYLNCTGSTIYYPRTGHAFQDSTSKFPMNCRPIWLPIIKENPISMKLFTFLGNEFTLGWKVSSECTDCHLRGGQCSGNKQAFVCLRFVPGRHSMKLNIKIIGASIIGAFLSLIGVWWFYQIVKKEISKRRKAKFFKENGGMLLQQQLSSGHGSVENTKLFKSFELDKATKFYNVDRVLGQGGQGTVYKGVLPDGRLVAVKKSKVVDKSNIEHFINEIVILSQINHRNVVNLLGCCFETKVPLLVYELISNGTLFQHIHNPTNEFLLNWGVRLRIAVEIAQALSYLHSAATRPIYHRDIKSTNILLDDNYNAKVSDFGISRLVDVGNTHLTTHVKGTFGYLDPEYFQSHQFNEKSDVYSFGVVLVELLTGQKPIISSPYQESKGLASHFLESMDDNRLFEIIEPQLSKEDKIEEMVEVAHLAKACLNSKGKKRPTMQKVVIQLEGIRSSREQSLPRDNDESNVVEECDDSSSSTGNNGSVNSSRSVSPEREEVD